MCCFWINTLDKENMYFLVSASVPFSYVSLLPVWKPPVLPDVYFWVAIYTPLMFKHNPSFPPLCCLSVNKCFLQAIDQCADSKQTHLKWLDSIALQFHFMGKSYFLLPLPALVVIKSLPLHYLFFFLNQEEDLASQPLLLFSIYRFITHQTGEEKRATKMEILSVLSAKQWKALPAPPFVCVCKAQVCRSLD